MMVAGCSQQGGSQQSPAGAKSAVSDSAKHPPDLTGWPIFDRSAKQVGLVATRLDKRGVTVTLSTRGLPPGLHGVHIHQNARCEAPSFASAGDHWNWTNKKHGHENPAGHHAGDLGNLRITAGGQGEATFVIPANDWDPKLHAGLSIVIHASADDEMTDPSGNSGERIACGLLYVRPD
jgi:superoxide dismutase, Cu-Zn family